MLNLNCQTRITGGEKTAFDNIEGNQQETKNGGKYLKCLVKMKSRMFQIIDKIQILELELDGEVQRHHEEEVKHEEVIQTKVKQLELLTNTLKKRREEFGEFDKPELSTFMASIENSGLFDSNETLDIANVKESRKSLECDEDSDESFKTAKED